MTQIPKNGEAPVLPEQESPYERPSKSQAKRDYHAMQELGRSLTELPTQALAQMDLPETVKDAVSEYARMNSFGAKRRQLLYIGKLMNRLDHDAIAAQILEARKAGRGAVQEMHEAEHWRGTLLKDEAACSEFIRRFPQTDTQKLRQLIRACRKETAQGKPPRAFRELFKLITESLRMNQSLAPVQKDDI